MKMKEVTKEELVECPRPIYLGIVDSFNKKDSYTYRSEDNNLLLEYLESNNVKEIYVFERMIDSVHWSLD